MLSVEKARNITQELTEITNRLQGDEFSAADNAEALMVVDADGLQQVEIPAGDMLLNAEFVRQGPDLLLKGTDGQLVLVRNFFNNESPPALINEGGARISGDIATQLSGPQAPGQHAQAAPHASASPIGQVEVLKGVVEVIRANGLKVTLSEGDAVFEGDVIETGADGSIGIIFADDSSFSLGENGRMTLDEMAYDAASQSGMAAISLVQGVFSYVSGQIAKTDPEAMVINTPSAVIGIRGTALAGKVDGDGALTAALMEENGGFTGELTLSNSAGVQIINQAGLAVNVSSYSAPPSQPFQMSVQEIAQSFGSAILSLPNASEHLPSSVNDAADEATASPQPVDESETAVEEEAAPVEEAAVIDNEPIIEMETAAMQDAGPVAPEEADVADKPEDGHIFGPDFLNDPFGQGGPLDFARQTASNPMDMNPGGLRDGGHRPFLPRLDIIERLMERDVREAVSENTISTFDEHIRGTTGDDVLNGGHGDTRFEMIQNVSLGGNDIVHGNNGVDEIYFSDLNNVELVYNADTTPPSAVFEGSVSGSVALNSIEQLYASDGVSGKVRLAFSANDSGYGYIVAGSASNDSIAVNGGATLLSGGHTVADASVLGSLLFGKGGDDNITGSSGGDVIHGGAGNDTLNGGDNAKGDPDTLWGGAGHDTLVINSASVIANGGSYSGGEGTDTLLLMASGSYDLDNRVSVTGIEKVAITNSNTTLTASNLFLNNLDSIGTPASATGLSIKAAAMGGNTLDLSAVSMDAGLVSNLTFRATDVDHGVTILDNASDTEGRTLIGGNGRDGLSGYGGDDILFGHAGADTLVGGSGADTFKYTAATDGGATVSFADTIMDFAGGVDTIFLQSAAFGSIASLSDGANYFEIALSGVDQNALNTALTNGAVDALLAAAGASDNIDNVAFLTFTDTSGGEDSATYLLYDDDSIGSDGVTVLADMNATTAADIGATDFVFA